MRIYLDLILIAEILHSEMGQLLCCYNNTTDDVEQCQEASVECSPDHEDRSMSLFNFCNSLLDGFQQRDVMYDLDEAIELH